MGERKGTNLYYPPDYDPRVGGLNKFKGTHALRERARKLHMGILIIRFEMPFNIWCDGCGNHIGMGVRYNAEKKKIGMYYSTPLYQFRMKCHLCNNHFEIKTDPANLTYIIESGARRQENRWDPKENEQVVPETKELSRRLYDDPMYKLEHGMDDKKKARGQESTLNQLIATNNAQWKDDYALNCAMRRSFRMKKQSEQQERNLSMLKNSGIKINLVEEHDDDVKLARILMQHKKGDTTKNSSSPLKQLMSITRSRCRKNKPSTSLSNVEKRIKQKDIISATSSSTPNINSISNKSLVNYDSSSSDSNS
ncbi:hypothetical protein PV325_010857 [Microctonus aethiopoides]|uniref:Coiled-coil domain-containing protein 130 n=1 Tax=Microctonus aethiopoides TaxID=144406 RepID=A0AA39FBF8_9HYME|nr:hypothetical protein PV325_010857 [Microctonus aethiopoides]KAK0091149.1 hypothetical protein PV326_003663 [Microctonus aethiopoides]KAK0166472.1 hypothetical protein PV328_004892 [Microctonus aethiopoides]